MRPTALALLLAVVGCAAPAAPAVQQSTNATLCACRVICAPDAYSWTMTYAGPAAPAGPCTCRSAR